MNKKSSFPIVSLYHLSSLGTLGIEPRLDKFSRIISKYPYMNLQLPTISVSYPMDKRKFSSQPIQSRVNAKKDPIRVTARAAERIKVLLDSPGGKNATGIRLGVKRRGCNGLSYTLNYAYEDDVIKPLEECFQTHGITVIIEATALFNMVGTVMDWEETDMSSEFTFENPNSKGECGCGESFNV